MKYRYSYAFSQLTSWVRSSFSFLWLILLAGYLIVLVGQAVSRNYKDEQDVQHLRDQLTQVKSEKERLQDLLVYYQSDNFKEKELRRSLLMKRPEEAMYALPEYSFGQIGDENSIATLEQALPDSANTPTEPVKGLGLPFWRQWIEYLLQGK